MKKINEELETTRIWQEYQKGVDYNRTKGIYADTEMNYSFYHGDQWRGAKTGDIKPIVLNVIKPIVKFKLGVINQNGYAVCFNPNNFDNPETLQDMQELCKNLSKNADLVWEREQIDNKIREVIKDGCINSEGIAYNFFDEEEKKIAVEVIDKNNIYYGNEADSDIQAQPYIIIAFRRTVLSVKEEAELNGISKEEIEKIVADNEIEEQAGYDGNNQEITDMCLVLLKLYKKNGTIHSKKCTKYATIQDERDHKTKLYPIAHFIWEDIKGSSRGIGEVKNNIANQIEINKTAMRRAIAVKLGAYPRAIINTTFVTNPEALKKTGATIEIDNGSIDDVRKQVGYLNPTSMSADSKYLQDELIKNTQDLAGAGDTVTGNVDPTQASGKAILAVQQSAQQPLNEQLNKFKTFLEDMARIWFDIWQAYETEGLTILKTEQVQEQDEFGNFITTEKEIPYTIPYDVLQQLKINIKVDITPKTPYDRFAVEQSLENLMLQQKITFEEYVDALPLDSVMDKQKLQAILKKREDTKKQIQAIEQRANEQMQQIQQSLMQRQLEENQLSSDIDNIEQYGNNQIASMIGGVQNAM